MKSMKKPLCFISAVLLLFFSAGILASCGKSKDESKVYVGMECGYAPFNYTQTDKQNGAVKISNAAGYANGYDVMIAKKIAEALGKELVIVKYYDFDALIPAVQAGTLDLIIAGMSPTDKRKEQVDFSDPYYESQLVIVVKKGSTYENATSLADFAGANLVAQSGTFHDEALQAEAATYGYTRKTPMATFPEMVNALKTGAVDGYVAEEPGAKSDCASNPELTYIPLVNNVTGFIASPGDAQIAVGMTKGSKFRSAVNEVLASLSEEDRLNLMLEATAYATGSSVVEGEEPKDPGLFAAMGEILKKYGGWILQGVGYTLLVSLVSTVLGLLIGILIGIFRTTPKPKNKALAALKKIADFLLSAYIEIFRGTPMMVQSMVIFWGFALLHGGRTMNVIFAGLLIVSVNTGAYMAEIVRGGILSVDKGQTEGAYAVGMSHFQTMRYVVLPQALRNILPSVANEFVINIKDTSVLNVIGFTELYFQAKTIVSINFNTFATYLLVAAIYFVLTFGVTRVLRLIEKKMDGKKNYVVLGSQNMDAESFARENTATGGQNNG